MFLYLKNWYEGKTPYSQLHNMEQEQTTFLGGLSTFFSVQPKSECTSKEIDAIIEQCPFIKEKNNPMSLAELFKCFSFC